jgi:hypothetical protein
MIRATVGILAGVGGGFDADYQAILDYATTQAYTLPSASQQALQNQLVVDLKDGGIWSKLDTFSVFATDGDSNFALIDWKRLIQMTAVNSPTFTSNQGFQGNGTSSYIDTNYNPLIDSVNLSQNDASSFSYIYSGSSGGLFETKSYLINDSSIILRNSDTSVQRFYSGDNFGSVVLFSGAGLKLFNRTSASTCFSFDGINELSSSAISKVLASSNIGLLQRASLLFGNMTMSINGEGSNLRTEQSNLNTALNTYLTAI